MAKPSSIEITNAEHLKRIASNIAKNYGITLSAYLKQKLRIVIENEPEHLKREFRKD